MKKRTTILFILAVVVVGGAVMLVTYHRRNSIVQVSISPGEISPTGEFWGFRIEGTTNFALEVARALKFIKVNDSEDFGSITNSINYIVQGNRSSVRLNQDLIWSAVAYEDAILSPDWCAGILAEQATTIRLYKSNQVARSMNQRSVSKREMYIAAAEQRVAVLEKLRAPKHHLDGARTLLKTYEAAPESSMLFQR